MLIRPATVGDAEALTDLHLDVWEEAYTGLLPDAVLRERRTDRDARVARWQANITTDGGQTQLACDDTGRLLGFVSIGAGRDETDGSLPELEVWALYVRAETYGTGVGHALLAHALGGAPAYLWVLDGNDRAIAFYERQGFRFDGAVESDATGVDRRMVRASWTEGA